MFEFRFVQLPDLLVEQIFVPAMFAENVSAFAVRLQAGAAGWALEVEQVWHGNDSV